MAYIEVIEHQDSTGELKEIYNQLLQSRGKIASVHTIQSLNPKSIVAHMELYQTIMFGSSPLSRAQREMMAVVVSVANNCTYCANHHMEALNHFWKDEKKVKKLTNDFQETDITELEQALCHYALKLTKKPWKHTDEKLVEKLRKAGLDDRSILDASLVVSYFNFVNRLVLSLGVTLEEDPGGYNYD